MLKKKKQQLHSTSSMRFSAKNVWRLSVIYQLTVLVRVRVRVRVGFPGDSVIKNRPANAEDLRSIPGSGRSPGEGNGNPLQSSCLGNPMDRGAWQATAHGVGTSRTWLSDWQQQQKLRVRREWELVTHKAHSSATVDELGVSIYKTGAIF